MSVFTRLLLDRNVVGRKELAHAIEHQVVYGGRLGTNLIELGYATEEQIAQALASHYGTATMPVRDAEIDPALLAEIGRDRCNRHKVFPHSRRSKTLRLLMIDPSDHVAKAEIAYASNYIVRPYVVCEYRMLELLDRYCGLPPQWRYEERGQNYLERARRHRVPRTPRGEEIEHPLEPWDLQQALSGIERAVGRDEIISAALRLLKSYCERVIFYIVRRQYVQGWDCAGGGLDPRVIRSQAFPLAEASVFQTIYENPGPFMGRIPRTAANDLLRKSIEKRTGNALLLPVCLAGRVVNIIYCDNGPRGDLDIDLREPLLLVNQMPEAYRRLIQKRIAEGIES